MSNEIIRLERKNKRIEKVRKMRIGIGIGIAVVLLAVIVFFIIKARKSEIIFDVKSVEIVQDQAVPEFSVNIKQKGKKERNLDKEKKYNVNHLLKEFQSGENYEIVCDADGKTDGKFKIKVKLSEEIEKKLQKEWSRKVKITINNGTLTVKNKYGAWEEDKFKKTDGKYASNEFIPFEGNMYYFDADGKKVTGEVQIGNKICTFSEDGKLESEKYYIDPNKPMIALTFDDGPGPKTNELLSVLEKYGARATFFMVGTQVEKYPDEVRKMKEIGCELGNHTKTHTDFRKLTKEEIQNEIAAVSDMVAEITGGSPTTVTRPPYGGVDDHVKEAATQPLIQWTIDTLDWKTKNVQSTINSVMNTSNDGDIVLMHDIHKTSVEAAVQVIPMLIEKGYQLVTVSELAEARGVTLENGEVYFSFYK